MTFNLSIRRFAVSAVVLGGTASSALAHPSLDHVAGLAQGFVHPISGYDHVLAMVAVGLLAARIGGRALWVVPGAFMSMMALGAVMGFTGVQIPFVEFGIATSIIVLAALAAIGTRLSTAVAAGVAAFFAVFHGFAHGAELPANVGGAEFAVGFLASTALLHAAGIVLGFAAALFSEEKQRVRA